MGATVGEQRFAFVVEWFDPIAGLMRQYQLMFYASDGTIEMFDIKNRRTFLKRCEYKNVGLRDLFIGSILTVYSRQLKIVNYADAFTAGTFEERSQGTVAIIKPDAYVHMGKIVDAIYREGFVIHSAKMLRLSSMQAEQLCATSRESPNFGELVEHMISDVVVAMLLKTDNAVSVWKEVCGSEDPETARADSPNSIRAQLGVSPVKNAVYCSNSTTDANRDADMLFGEKARFAPTAQFNNCSLCLVKPHAVKAGYSGQILDQILSAGFEISALEMLFLERQNAEEFLQVYQGVVPEYREWVHEMSSGQCLALEIRCEGAVGALRQLSGAMDPEVATHLHPNSLRSKFGENKVKNGVHCTDLPEDGELETEYFFRILQA